MSGQRSANSPTAKVYELVSEGCDLATAMSRARAAYLSHEEGDAHFRRCLLVTGARLTQVFDGKPGALRHLIYKISKSGTKLSVSDLDPRAGRVSFFVMAYLLDARNNKDRRKTASFYGRAIKGALASKANSPEAL
jgi:hypothetical protein